MSQNRHQGESGRQTLCRLPAIGLLGIATAMFFCGCAQERTIGINERIHHDDFEYRVTRFQIVDSIGAGEQQHKASGAFYLVDFEVENRAKRVGHNWDDSIAYLVDESGRSYENLPEMQKILNEAQPFNYMPQHSTPAGATESTRLVFDLPRGLEHPCLMVRGELLMGDVFDGKAFAKTRVRLYVP